MAEAFEAHVKGGGTAAGFSGEFLDLDPGGVGEGEKFFLFGPKCGEAMFEGGVLLGALIELFDAFRSHEFENILTENKAVAGHFSPVGQSFEAGDDTGPLHEGGVAVKFVKLPPGDEGGLLEDLIGVVPCGEKRADEAAQIRLGMGEMTDERFVAIVVGCGIGGVSGHTLSKDYCRRVEKLTGFLGCTWQECRQKSGIGGGDFSLNGRRYPVSRGYRGI